MLTAVTVRTVVTGSTIQQYFLCSSIGMSCLFNSLGRLLAKDPQALRQEICNYLEAGSPVVEGLNTVDILTMEAGDPTKYIANMRRPQTWGGAIEIQAAAVLHSARIVVRNIRSFHRVRGRVQTQPVKDIEFLPLTGTIGSTLTVSWNGGHYEPVSKS